MPLHTGHIGLNVTDLDRSIAFYTGVLGFEVLGRSDEDGQKFAFLGDPNVASEVFLDKLAITLWEQSDGRFSTGNPGLHHLALHVDSVDEVERLRARVQDAGAELLYDGEIIPHSDAFSSGGFFFLDPDGLRLEVCAPDGVPTADAVAGATPSCGFFD
ncbi:VOC family protein [Gordonia sp. PP30]|uniref:VOC family protein n=1 Tax=unclassified Gordonia (in: high G+C Gram-positive bacteria) TaxID=2657482 RepID=UPI001FFF5E44|nr:MULTISPECIES: VOC family protein [unclassified Gordonia (in: high G+C Gram-positive bacteria)]UQE76804.1 VOC family protein [Gordonia sp. PP30]